MLWGPWQGIYRGRCRRCGQAVVLEGELAEAAIARPPGETDHEACPEEVELIGMEALLAQVMPELVRKR